MKNRILTVIYFLVGISLCVYPLISGLAERRVQENTVATYRTDMDRREDLDDILQQAREYNSMLSQAGDAVVGDVSETVLNDENYERQLAIGQNGIMGSIEIPKISVNLPIRHGTTEKVISNGVGHFQESSLPVGGENTRCILTSHRGLPSSKLFTRLDELKEGDLFFINVCGETLAYQIYDIQVMEPEEAEKLNILAGRDIVSLVTCTPYGLNTHRLVVNGERVSYEKKVHDRIRPAMFSLREFIFLMLPFVFIAVMAGMYIRDRRRRKRRKCIRARRATK